MLVVWWVSPIQVEAWLSTEIICYWCHASHANTLDQSLRGGDVIEEEGKEEKKRKKTWRRRSGRRSIFSFL